MITDIVIICLIICLIAVITVLFLKMFKNSKSQAPVNLDEILKIINQTNKTQIDAINNYTEGVSEFIKQNLNLQRDNLLEIQNRLEKVLESNEKRLEDVRAVIANGLEKLQNENQTKLEQMRQTVDEKLNATLEKRLGESFNLVTTRLQEVYKGLGEMQVLASGVGDLKKVLTNVKTRGVWGEVSLDNLLSQILAPQQYQRNVATKQNSQERVDFVIKLPGKNDDSQTYLPIDAKFPLEDYQRLVDATERNDLAEIEENSKKLERRIRDEAKSICAKYINPPTTTDFAILFLPTEGLYAEVIRKSGFVEEIQQNYKIIISGPTTISALLNSLQLGFKTLYIEKRSSEIWNLLGAFKKDFNEFSTLLVKTQKKLQEASNSIEGATKRTSIIAKRLKNVSLPGSDNDVEQIEDLTEKLDEENE